MTDKPIDLKGKKVLRSIELHKDLKPEAVRRILNDLSNDALKKCKTERISILLIKD